MQTLYPPHSGFRHSSDEVLTPASLSIRGWVTPSDAKSRRDQPLADHGPRPGVAKIGNSRASQK